MSEATAGEGAQFHAPTAEGLFAPSALCGATADGEPGGVLRLHQSGLDVTCPECRAVMLGDSSG